MATLKRDAAGNYVLRYYTGGRGTPKAYKNLGKVSYKKALELADKELVKGRAPRVGDPNLTFKGAAAEYTRTHVPTLSESAKARTESMLRLHLNPAFGAIKVDELRPIEVERFRRVRLEAGAAAGTVNREWALFKAILNRAEAWGLIDRNPLRRGAVKILATDPGRLVFFEAEEWSKFLGAFDGKALEDRVSNVRRLGPVKLGAGAPEPRRYGGGRLPDSDATADYVAGLLATRPVFETLLYTGSRLGEVLSLTWEAVDLSRGLITFAQSKTGRSKVTPISRDLMAVLKALPRGVGAAPVFVRPDGSPFYKMEVQRAFALAKKVSGIREELTVHTLRHTFASWLASRGVPLRTIQELLGHADIRMTIRYAHLAPAHLREAVETIAGTIRGRTVDETGNFEKAV